ncbi:MAG: tRNA 2-thiocytidine biosynthesis protein TtcA [Bradymonadia bacterium]|jgi:tRNA 2-thiocytidine biosynthesis protein TtcA
MPVFTPLERAHRGLKRRMLKTVGRFGLIEPGDRIMVCLSGGKDSYTLFDLLADARHASPVPYDLVAVHVDQSQPGYDGRPLNAWLDGCGWPSEVVRRDTYSRVLELTKNGGTYCAPCARMRRGILYETAERLGCNKIALGHHRDDALETLLMNLFYAGRLQAMPAKYRTDDGRFDVIRPLIECAEPDIIEYAALKAYPILPCNLCGSQSGLKRDAMTALITQLEQTIPNVRQVMLAAISNVSATHLLDPTLTRRGEAQPVADDANEALGGGCDGPADAPALVQIG